MIKTSRHTKEIVSTLTRKLGLGFENHISRIAFGYSISQKIALTNELKLSNEKEEYNKHISDLKEIIIKFNSINLWNKS